MTISRSICSLPELTSANTAQLRLPSRARTSMRCTMPSGPGAVDTRIRSCSVRWRSTAAVRSMAAASSRTPMASTATAGLMPPSIARTARRAATALATRVTIKRPPPGLRNRSKSAGNQWVRLTIRRFRGFFRGSRGQPIPWGSSWPPYHSSNGQDDLTDMGAGLHPGVCRGGLRQWKGRIHDRPHPPRGNQREHVLLDAARDRGLVGDRPRAQHRPGMRQPLEHDATEINGCLWRTLKGDLHDPSFDGRRLVVALDVVPSHHVEDNIGALAGRRVLGRGDEVFGLIVNGDVGAERAAGFAFLRRARRGDHPRARLMRQLNRCSANTRRTTMHQQRLAGLETAALE